MTDVASPVTSGVRRLARNTIVYAVADLIAKGGAYALIPLLTRLLPESDYGLYTIVVSILPVLVIVASLGVGGAVTRLWFDLTPEERPRFHLAAWAATQSVALGVSIALTLASGPLFRAIFADVSPSLFVFAVWIAFFLTSATVPLAFLRAEERAKSFAVLSGSQFVAPAIGVVVAVVVSDGVRSVLWGHLAGSAFVLVLSLAFLRRHIAMPARWDLYRPALALGLPIVPHLIAHWALNVADRVAIERALGAAAVGLYAVGYQIAQGVSLIATAINNATVPAFYRAAQNERRDALGRAWSPLLFGIGAFSLGVALFGEEIVVLFAARQYRSADAFIPWVALGYWFLAAYYFPVNALFYAKRVRMIPVATLTAAVVNYLLNVWMLPDRGLVAAAQNTAIAYFLLFAIVLVAAQRVHALPYRYGRAAFIGAMGTAIYLVSTLLPSGLAGTALKVPLMAAYLAAGFVIVRGDLRAIGGNAPPFAPNPPGTVVLAAATTTQARTMLAVADAVRAAGFTPRFVSLDPIAGKNAAAGFREAGVVFDEIGEPASSERARRIAIVLRGRPLARSLVRGAAAVVVGNDFTPFERLVLDEARKVGCVSALLQDGVIALDDAEQVGGGARSGSGVVNVAKRVLSAAGLPFDARPYGMGGADLVCVYGPSTAAALERRGVPRESLRVTGQPRYDGIVSGTGARQRARAPKRRSGGAVLVTTQPFSRYGMASLDDETRLFAAMIDAAVATGHEVVVKLHPDTDAASRDALASRTADGVVFEQLAPIETLLSQASALVSLSSTTALEAMLFGVPAVVVDAPGFPTTLPYLSSGAVHAARTPAEIAPKLQEALRDGADEVAVDRFLSEHLAPLDGSAASRVVTAIREAISARVSTA